MAHLAPSTPSFGGQALPYALHDTTFSRRAPKKRRQQHPLLANDDDGQDNDFPLFHKAAATRTTPPLAPRSAVRSPPLRARRARKPPLPSGPPFDKSALAALVGALGGGGGAAAGALAERARDPTAEQLLGLLQPQQLETAVAAAAALVVLGLCALGTDPPTAAILRPSPQQEARACWGTRGGGEQRRAAPADCAEREFLDDEEEEPETRPFPGDSYFSRPVFFADGEEEDADDRWSSSALPF